MFMLQGPTSREGGGGFFYSPIVSHPRGGEAKAIFSLYAFQYCIYLGYALNFKLGVNFLNGVAKRKPRVGQGKPSFCKTYTLYHHARYNFKGTALPFVT